MTVGLFVMMMVYGGWLVWVVSGFTLVYILIRMMTYRTYRQFSEEQIVKAAKANSHFMETLYGISTVKALGIKETRSSYWLNLNVDAANTNIKITRFNMMFGGINTFITTLDQVAILLAQRHDGHRQYYDARHVHGVQRLSRPVLAAGFQPDRSGDRPAHAVAAQ